MKSIKKYISFEKLKSSETNNEQNLDVVKKHQDFEKAILLIRNSSHSKKNMNAE
ncbi:MAG: hypothetical protein ACI85I_001666 [Arenicella sp.]|jgi:hypothetical protein